MDPLALKDRIELNIAWGESSFREFKSALCGKPGAKRKREVHSVCRDIAETLVAFANADGGELLVGVEDQGTITGHEFTEEEVELLFNAPYAGVHRDTPLPTPLCMSVAIKGNEILYFAVDKSTLGVHQTSDGRCLQRRDMESVPVAAITIQFERQEQISREYDRGFVQNASMSSLDLDLVNQVKSATPQLARFSVEKFLQHLGLAEYNRGVLSLRRAALLLFAKDINHWHPRCQVRILRIAGTELKTGRDYNVGFDETISGNLFELIQRSYEQLRPHLVSTKLNLGGLFREQVIYPEDAIQEALINAITHRDYSIEGQGIEITIFDDRMTVQSPGALLATVNIEDLRKEVGSHESRNAHLTRVLKEFGYVREMGEGMRRIYRLMNDADLVPPILESARGQFKVSFSSKSVFSSADQAWLAHYKVFKLNRQEMLICIFGKNKERFSPKEIFDLLKLQDWDEYREIYERLSIKEIICDTLTKSRRMLAGRQKNIKAREVERLVIRDSEILMDSLTALLEMLQAMPMVPEVDLGYIGLLIERLPQENIYRSIPDRLLRLLKALGYLDERNQALPALLELWRAGTAGASTSPKVPAPPQPAPKTTSKAPASGSRVSLVIKNLHREVREPELRDLLETAGPILTLKVPTDYETKASLGKAFVTMETHEGAERLVREFHGRPFRGQVLNIRIKVPST